MNSKFINPYRGAEYSESGHIKINAVIPQWAHARIRRVTLRHGTIKTVISILWQKLINELDKRGINEYTHQDDFERLITDSSFCLPGERAEQFNSESEIHGGATTLPQSEADARDDGDGTPSGSAAHAVDAPESSHTPRKSVSRRKRSKANQD